MSDRSTNKELIEKKIKDGFVGQKMFVMPKKVIEKIKHRPLIKTLYITDIGYFPNARYHFRERKKGCNSYLLLYCINGTGIIELSQHEITLKPNMFYIIPARTPHKYKADNKNPWTIYWVHFWGENSENIYKKFSESIRIEGLPVSFDERRILLLNNIMEVLEQGYSIDNLDYINISLWQLLISFIYDEYYMKIGEPDQGHDMVKNTISYVLKNIDKPLIIKDIAEHFNYSNSHFLTLFRKKTGFTPIQYFNNLKVQKACMYLCFTDMSIKEICFSLGYNDPLYFSRLFKKIIGESPNSYRTKNPR